LYDTIKDDISKANDISVDIDDFKEANEALEYQYEVLMVKKVKLSLTSLKMRTKNH
jgi:nicotinate-nucleotide pyrophosphorylase